MRVVKAGKKKIYTESKSIFHKTLNSDWTIIDETD